jgi:hypothetical protein
MLEKEVTWHDLRDASPGDEIIKRGKGGGGIGNRRANWTCFAGDQPSDEDRQKQHFQTETACYWLATF